MTDFMISKITKFNLDYISIILICLLPLALVTGPFVPDFFLSLVGLMFIITSTKKKLWKYYKNNYVYLFTFFYLYLVTRSIFSVDPIFSLNSSLFYFRYLFFSLSIWYLADNYPNLIKYLGISILLILSIVSIDGLYQYISGFNILGWSSGHDQRLAGFFRDELIIGGYIARLLPIAIALLASIYFPSKKNIFIIILFLVLSEVVVFLSGERSAFFMIALFSILIIILANNFKMLRLFTLIISILFIFLINLFNSSAKERIINTTIEQVNSTQIPYAPYSSHHEMHYMTALNMFNDNPIFGQGPHLFRKLCDDEKFIVQKLLDEKNYFNGCSTHPHNHYIQLLAETGIIGFIFLLMPFLLSSYFLTRQLISKFSAKKKGFITDKFLILIICVFIYTWPFIPTGSFFSNWTNVIFYLPVGFILSDYYKKIFKL